MNFRLMLLPLLLFSSPLLAQSAAIAVYCFDDNDGASVYGNGSFIGECSRSGMISELPPGDVEIRATKSVGEDHERAYTKTLRLGSGGLTKVVVELGAPTLTLAAKERMERERIEKEKAAAAAVLRRAEAGDVTAMRELAGYYREGKGVNENPSRSRYWDEKARETQERMEAETIIAEAKAGLTPAMRNLATLYETGKGVEKSPDKAQVWREKADSLDAERMLDLAAKGNKGAMKRLAEMYQSGTGIKQDIAQSDYWMNRYREEQAREIKLSGDKRIQEEMDNISYFEKTAEAHKFLWAWEGGPWITSEHVPTSGKLFLSTASPYLAIFLYPGALTSDAAIAPTKLTRYNKLKRSLAGRAAVFHRPESMLAQAYQNKE